MVTLLSIIAGIFFLIIGFVCLSYFPALSDFIEPLFLFFIMLSAIFIMLGIFAKPIAREIELRAYGKERERRKVQQPIHPAAAEPIAQLQYCPSCGKKLQPDWKVCGYCGKRLKKSD